jgi:hypothetical protein
MPKLPSRALSAGQKARRSRLSAPPPPSTIQHDRARLQLADNHLHQHNRPRLTCDRSRRDRVIGGVSPVEQVGTGWRSLSVGEFRSLKVPIGKASRHDGIPALQIGNELPLLAQVLRLPTSDRVRLLSIPQISVFIPGELSHRCQMHKTVPNGLLLLYLQSYGKE